MSFYNRWQSLNLVENIRSIAFEAIEEPWSKGGAVLGLQIVYWVLLLLTVCFLRRDSQREQE